MELVVFDLDGTLLNRDSVVSARTARTLRMLADRGIAYTVATGRMLHGSREVLAGHGFRLPHIFKNGVMTWDPSTERYSHISLLTQGEIRHILEAVLAQGVAPFIFTHDADGTSAVYHGPLHNETEQGLARYYREHTHMLLRPAAELPGDADIVNISAIGDLERIHRVAALVEAEDHLVAYAGSALEGEHLGWIDIHHSEASKGGAILRLKQDLGARSVICFGDSDNDLSMFAMADECYAPSNAKPEIKAAATAVIGHHDADGIAEFLCQRFGLG